MGDKRREYTENKGQTGNGGFIYERRERRRERERERERKREKGRERRSHGPVRPRAPSSLQPQVHTAPSLMIAALCSEPALIDTTCVWQ
jgi:hypothetical protein